MAGGLDPQPGQHAPAGSSPEERMRALVEPEPVPDLGPSPAAHGPSLQDDYPRARARGRRPGSQPRQSCTGHNHGQSLLF